jgi:hypothetical protein
MIGKIPDTKVKLMCSEQAFISLLIDDLEKLPVAWIYLLHDVKPGYIWQLSHNLGIIQSRIILK